MTTTHLAGNQPNRIDDYADWNEDLLARQGISRWSMVKAVAGGAGHRAGPVRPR